MKSYQKELLQVTFDFTGMYEFYEDQLKNRFLPFWLKKSPDSKRGGYFTCFNNVTGELVSKDKYTWSQGRMVWLLSKLGTMRCFSQAEQAELLELARSGALYIRDYVILDGYRCAFLTDESGRHKPVNGIIDASILADMFVTMGFGRYATVSNDHDFYGLATSLYESILGRVAAGGVHSQPYPDIPGFRTHARLMGLLDLSKELMSVMSHFNDRRYHEANTRGGLYVSEIFRRFRDKNNLIREMILDDCGIDDNLLLTRYINPGHTIEDMWFIMHYALKNNNETMINDAAQTLKATFDRGWDKEYGGLFLFADKDGGEPRGSIEGIEDEVMTRKVQNDWSSKLWWPHSEALYALALAFVLTRDKGFYERYNRLFEYVFTVFPNPGADGEWIQIRNRKGEPENRVVALPVKDPYHIMRNFVLLMDIADNGGNSDTFRNIII